MTVPEFDEIAEKVRKQGGCDDWPCDYACLRRGQCDHVREAAEEPLPAEEEGELCRMPACFGRLEYTPDGCCACHTLRMPPCRACENAKLGCSVCGASR